MSYFDKVSDSVEAPSFRNRSMLRASIPVICTLVYPGFVDIFHISVGEPGSSLSLGAGLIAGFMLVLMFSVPLIGFAFAVRGVGGSPSLAFETRARRLAYAVVVGPTMYCLVGVLQILASSPIPDQVIWVVLWCLGLLWLWATPDGHSNTVAPARPIPWLRVAHGVSAAVVLIYIAFHLANHLFALLGQEAHTTVMNMGRTVYRSPIGETILVAAMLFQVISGLILAWRWSSHKLDFYKTFQVASGFFLSIFILGHMNAVFVLARMYFGIPTDWDFATGAPNGLIHDWWSARLIPHYALAILLLIGHSFSGLRVVMLAHGTSESLANRVWWVGQLGGACLSTTIMLAMCGFRI
ncbi:hypothetical protein M2418_002633 [Rhizobium sp. BIGb0125]|uniref:hypothetical protein n=1 Tax=Rhizobium sp. BIGb0125 TaxID=2940618 RepID=UPI0021696EA3|nr:hypothetical protein [Rhizobium sp. BIGb0125]MCS4243102.1 hypothetical protein [Rhizobium sp. BIGb0125]